MSRASRCLRITGKTLRFLFFLVIFSVIAFLLWRMISSDDPKSMKTLTPNEKLVTAYERQGENLLLFRQTQNKMTYAASNYGYFGITDCIFIPDANQIQLVFRYNNATIRHLTEDYALEKTPERSEELYDVTLLFAIDRTPENSEDNDGNDPDSVSFLRLHPVSVTSDEKNVYNYRRFVFDLDEAGLSLADLTQENGLLLAVYADIYYNQDIRYDESAYGTLCIYDYSQEKQTAALEKQDRKALEAYRSKDE